MHFTRLSLRKENEFVCKMFVSDVMKNLRLKAIGVSKWEASTIKGDSNIHMVYLLWINLLENKHTFNYCSIIGPKFANS